MTSASRAHAAKTATGGTKNARIVTTLAAGCLALALAACGAPASADRSGSGDGADRDDASGAGASLRVMASFYPLQWLTQQIAGDAITVGSLTPKGAEPHDSELELSQVSALGSADLLVTLGGFQAAVDQAVVSNPPKAVLDVAPLVGLENEDPHFWLDPVRLADLATPIAQALAEADPDAAEDYQSRADAAATELGALDQEIAAGLADYSAAVLVTTHAAFNYFAQRYGLEAMSISGVDPEAEPSPARISEVAKQIEGLKVKTIYFEDQASPKTAEVLADKLGLETDVLSPLENDSAGDYLEVMRANLKALQSGLVAP
ncbi:MAG: metal ABC transporter substrate-binding protein [Bifidobacteriaceae bacterium]|jgi:zinc transport system substrate-binding protein|nr:metal ABC transporter substrate-binding protein [Bifidobacteriaceae bacterium]